MIRFEDASKTYASMSRPALDRITLTVEQGEFSFLVGPNGSGKTTLIRLILKEEKPTTGTVWVFDRNVGKMRSWRVPKHRRQIGTVFQDFRLLPNRSVSQNVAFALEVIGRKRAEVTRMVPEALEMVG